MKISQPIVHRLWEFLYRCDTYRASGVYLVLRNIISLRALDQEMQM